MIAKIIRQTGFVEPCFYAMTGDRKRPEVLAANGVRTSSAGEMAADFELQRSLRPGVRQAVEHIALAWPPGETEKLTNEVMVRAALLYLEERGIDPATTQWALVRHHDQEHPHCHLLLNRVTDDGQVLPDKKSHINSALACRKVESAMGFVDAAKLGAAAKLEQARQGKVPADVAERLECKDLIRQALEKHLPMATTVRELQEGLATEGVRMKATMQRGNQLQAVVFEADAYPGLYMKGSEVAREYSGVGLRKTLEKQAEERAAAAALAGLRSQPVVATLSEPPVVLPTPSASAAPLESQLPVFSRQVVATPAEGPIEAAIAPTAVGTQLPSVPLPERSVSLLVPEAALPPAVVVAGLPVSLTEATEPAASRSPLGGVVPTEPPIATPLVAAVAQPPIPAPETPEVARQAEQARNAADRQAAAVELAAIKRERDLIAAILRQADHAEHAGDYAKVAELRYGLVPEAQQRIAAHQEQANATPTGRTMLAALHAQEQEQARVAAQVQADAQRQLTEQREAEVARQAAEAARLNGQGLARAAVAAVERAQQQVDECRTQAEVAERKGDYARVAVLRYEHLPVAERHLQRCQEQVLAPSIQASLAQIAAEQKARQEQAHAVRERGQLAVLEDFHRRWPYDGTHIRLQVPVEYLPTVMGAIRSHNHREYEWEEHADKTRTRRVVEGKVSINVFYGTDENVVKLDNALREFRKNGVEVFEQPTTRTKREEQVANIRAFERQNANGLGRGSASLGKALGNDSEVAM